MYFFTDVQYQKMNTDLLLECFMFLASLVAFLTAFLNLARSFIDPCAPPFLGSYWLNCPLCYGPNPERNFITWIPILVLDFYFIIEIMHKGFFYPIQIVFATTGRLVDYVDVISRYRKPYFDDGCTLQQLQIYILHKPATVFYFAHVY